MDPRLIDLFNEELLHLRSEAAEFAREFPDRAARLALDEQRVEDPYVERLLEGVAFLAARVRLKMDAQYPVFTQQLLEVLFPGWLDPSPSCCVLELQPDVADAKLAAGVEVPRGSWIVGALRGRTDVRCDFETAAAARLWPLRIAGVRYTAARPGGSPLPQVQREIQSSLSIELEWLTEGGFATAAMDRLPLFVTLADAYGSQLMELLAGRCLGATLSADAAGREVLQVLPAEAIRHMGFPDDEALFRVPNRGHAGFRVLKEYAAFPDRFRFVEVSQLRAGLAKARGTRLFLNFYFAGEFRRLEAAIGPDAIALHCVPVVNARERPLDRIDVAAGQMEYRLVGDRMRVNHHEILHVVEVFAGGSGFERPVRPIFEVLAGGRRDGGSFYALRRERRMLSQNETRGRAANYLGADTFLSLVEEGAGPQGRDLRYLSVRARCSNRDQPLFLRAQFSEAEYQFVESMPVKQLRCLAGPSAPLSSSVDGFDPWVALSHLYVNYLTLTDMDGARGADALRAMLHLYAPTAGHFLMRQSDGLVAVHTEQITRRVPGGGPLAFGRGVGVRLQMNDRAFDGGSPFLLAAVLEHYFATHVSINSFAESSLELVDRAERLRWPTRFGRRPTY